MPKRHLPTSREKKEIVTQYVPRIDPPTHGALLTLVPGTVFNCATGELASCETVRLLGLHPLGLCETFVPVGDYITFTLAH